MDQQFVRGLAPVYHRYISRTRSAFCSWLANSETSAYLSLWAPFMQGKPRNLSNPEFKTYSVLLGSKLCMAGRQGLVRQDAVGTIWPKKHLPFALHLLENVICDTSPEPRITEIPCNSMKEWNLTGLYNTHRLDELMFWKPSRWAEIHFLRPAGCILRLDILHKSNFTVVPRVYIFIPGHAMHE